MRTFIPILPFMILVKISSGQDTKGRFEFGSTILTVNSSILAPQIKDKSYSTYDAAIRPPFEFINGLFFRYTKHRLALRVQTSYSDYSSSNSYTTEAWPYGSIGGDINNKDFQIGVGGQFSIIKHGSWLYTCLDIAYRHVYSTGHSYGGGWFTQKFTRTSNGSDCFIGVGSKIKVFKNFNLSPEIGCNTSFQFYTTEYIATDPNMFVNRPFKYSDSDIILNPVAKLHLTVIF